jgi:hypothetical protein
VNLTLASGTSYSGFDRFGRVIDLPWSKPGVGDLARIKYGYDLASNRTFRRDEVARGQGRKFDGPAGLPPTISRPGLHASPAADHWIRLNCGDSVDASMSRIA